MINSAALLVHPPLVVDPCVVSFQLGLKTFYLKFIRSIENVLFYF